MIANQHSAQTQKTAAGDLYVLASAFSSKRGGTRVFMGTLADGIYCVSSRFQVEVRTSDQKKAIRIFSEVCSG